jgi:hypothetical protein
MSRFVFDGAGVLDLLEHAKAAPKTTSPYGMTEDPGPGLFLVKDDGIYVMSNGEPHLPGTESRNKVIYARGYEPLPRSASVEDRMAFVDKVRAAAGGDDFAEFVPAKSLEKLERDGLLEINLTSSKMTISVIRKLPEKPEPGSKNKQS